MGRDLCLASEVGLRTSENLLVNQTKLPCHHNVAIPKQPTTRDKRGRWMYWKWFRFVHIWSSATTIRMVWWLWVSWLHLIITSAHYGYLTAKLSKTKLKLNNWENMWKQYVRTIKFAHLSFVCLVLSSGPDVELTAGNCCSCVESLVFRLQKSVTENYEVGISLCIDSKKKLKDQSVGGGYAHT